jgi:hypothetical protein
MTMRSLGWSDATREAEKVNLSDEEQARILLSLKFSKQPNGKSTCHTVLNTLVIFIALFTYFVFFT